MAAVDESKVTVVVRRTINATMSVVYRAWTDPELARQWSWGRDYDTISIELDARVGGMWRQQIRDRKTGVNWFFEGEFKDLKPPRFIVHTFRFRNDRGEDEEPSIVEIELRDLGGKTDVLITHSQLPADKKAGTEEGWNDCCECMESVARDPKRR